MRCLTILAVLICSPTLFAGDWPTFGHDPQRSGWAHSEKAFTVDNVSNLELRWKTKVENEGNLLFGLTVPVVALDVTTTSGVKNVAYVVGKQGTIFALDSESGEIVWQWVPTAYVLPNNVGLQGSLYCPNGVIATPTIDRRTNILYTIAENGSLYGLDLGSGAIRFGPVAFVSPMSKSWSLNLDGDTIYTTLAQGCGGGLGGFYSMDVSDRHHPVIRQMLLSNTTTGGVWGRGGPIIGKDGRVYGATADGPTDPEVGDYSNSVVGVSLDELELVDYFTPANWFEIYRKDLDYSSGSPVWFGWKGYNLLASAGKEGVVYLHDTASLGGKDHQTPLAPGLRLGNDDKSYTSAGVYGGLSTWRNEQGETWLYVPMYGPKSKSAPVFRYEYGDTPNGSVMAFKVVGDEKPKLKAVWMSSNYRVPDPVVIANGVVFALETGENPHQRGQGKIKTAGSRLSETKPAMIHALDARTGKELYNSGDSFETYVHFSGLAIAGGRVYAVDADSNVYCFGLKAN